MQHLIMSSNGNGTPSNMRTVPLHVPNELLQMIFGYLGASALDADGFLGGFRETFFSPDAKDIRNVRLTCRQWCANSSHLLLPYLEVTATPASLERLSAISNCPSVARGVRAVRVSLDLYYIRSLEEFAVVGAESLRINLKVDEDSFAAADAPHPGCGCGPLSATSLPWLGLLPVPKHKHLHGSLRGTRSTAHHLLGSRWPSAICSHNRDGVTLETLFQEYQRLRRGLVPAVTEAMTRMPRARTVCIANRYPNIYAPRPWRHSARSRDADPKDMVQDSLQLTRHILLNYTECRRRPESWAKFHPRRPHAQFFEQLYKLPASLYEAGVKLRYLDIDLDLVSLFIEDGTTAPPSSQEADAIRAVADTLTTFRYHGPQPTAPCTAREGWHRRSTYNLARFLKTVATGAELRNLRLESDLHDGIPRFPTRLNLFSRWVPPSVERALRSVKALGTPKAAEVPLHPFQAG